MGFVLIRPGSFMMGDEKGDADEKPVHKVTISKPFYLGKFEVTQEQWQAVMGSNPSHFRGAKNPVDRVSWEACEAFIKKLNAKFAPALALPSACPPRRSGNTPAAQVRRRSTASAIAKANWPSTVGLPATPAARRIHRPKEAKRLGIVRHARQRLGVVRRLVRRGLL